MNKKLLILALSIALPACSHLDNYMLGKDNTPTPTELEPLKPKVALQEKWSVPVSSKVSNANLKLKPAIVGNVVYTADPSGSIEAVDKSNGKTLWTKKLANGIVSGPSVSAGSVALGTDSSSIVLLKQVDGSELWTAKVSSEVLSKPIITNSKIIAKTIDGNLYAFDVVTGKQLWVSEHGAPSLILKASSSPVIVANKLILVGYSDGKMDAVDLDTGHLVWQRSIAYASGSSDVERLVDIDADPIVRGNVVYLASYQGYVGALSLVDGQFLWRKPASVYKNMAIDDTTLYITDSDDVVWALNRQTGQVNWKQVALKARGLTEPVLMGNRLVVGDKTGLLHVLAKNNGNLLSRAQLGGSITTAPSVSSNNIYVMTNNGKLNRFSVS
ncbi:outer membrane protein assembly factor BamB [Legionella hackeliae]|uniref:Outer membrane protein assembly factor BamB n=1 Tax=Legionella hackeliae TaxID=449 RepID=A0A0A8UUA5_LEGHA|nr:outer membrane protein assembly factor BamB [Legionella hackeliae]KTD13928.1 PQQ (pyrrolo quinoline) WD40-like repeat, enzyme repeat domain protein [Legionella hackeliae]CEK10632.1 PQQ (Pyrrolo quinoline) WD40-like repeat, enzyme repeat domain protein [Legionella hackeliae]STX47374.1 PQQ (pyrrolo quinoline) WD40-like repeat, enzyme repeat domain protein [Legionella hackeliae]